MIRKLQQPPSERTLSAPLPAVVRPGADGSTRPPTGRAALVQSTRAAEALASSQLKTIEIPESSEEDESSQAEEAGSSEEAEDSAEAEYMEMVHRSREKRLHAAAAAQVDSDSKGSALFQAMSQAADAEFARAGLRV